MKKKRYIIRPNWCNCHPETCCCDDYVIWDTKKNKKLMTIFNLSTAEHVIKKLNKKAKKK